MATTIYLIRPETYPVTSYLLDDYTASAAYSLRQLKTGVTNVVRVRRSSDNAKSDFTADEITDGTLTTWTGANDGFVVTWYDQSGNGNDVTQSTEGNQPRLVISGVVNQGVEFPSNDYLSKGSALSAFNAEPFSYTMVTSSSSSTAYRTIFTTSSGTTSRLQTYAGTRSTTPYLSILHNGTTQYDTIAISSLNTSTYYLHTGISDSSKNIETWINGTSQDTDTWTGTFTNNDFIVGANQGFSQYLLGVVKEIIIFDTDESANRTAIESDINTYYSIY